MSRVIELRFQMRVEEGSFEEMVLDFIRNKEVTTYSRHQRILMALVGYWLPLAYLYQGEMPERAKAALQEVIHQWSIQQSYLQMMLGSMPAPMTTDSPIPVPPPAPVEQVPCGLPRTGGLFADGIVIRDA
jgi:hypothetical protein